MLYGSTACGSMSKVVIPKLFKVLRKDHLLLNCFKYDISLESDFKLD